MVTHIERLAVLLPVTVACLMATTAAVTVAHLLSNSTASLLSSTADLLKVTVSPKAMLSSTTKALLHRRVLPRRMVLLRPCLLAGLSSGTRTVSAGCKSYPQILF
jgi:hypothetical protein